MIILQLPNSTPTTAVNGLVDRVILNPIVERQKILVADDVGFGIVDCEYTERVFHKTGGDEYQNDKSSFLTRKLQSSDVVEFELWKDNAKVADLNDNTYGTFFDSFGESSLLMGFVLDWSLVFGGFGNGSYFVKEKTTILGDSTEEDSRKFQLMEYDDRKANGTVRIETVESGKIERSDIDLTGVEWESSYRIFGFFGRKTPTLEVDNYLNSNYELLQNRDKIVNEYELETKLLPNTVYNVLLYESMLANSVKITDYNVRNNEVYRSLPVYPKSFDDVVYFAKNKLTKFVIKFSDKKEDIIKRNY